MIHVVQIQSCFIQTQHFIAVNANTRERGRPWKGSSMYILCSHPTTPSLTDPYQRPTPTSLFKFQNSTASIFKFSHFYIFSTLITYCIILPRIITCVTNPISLRRSTRLYLFIINLLPSPMLYWREELNLVATCARVWSLRGTFTFKVLS